MAATDNSPKRALALPIPGELIEQLAQRAAELVLAQLALTAGSESPYMTIPEAAAYARCKRQRIDDLLSSRRLTRHKDGRRTLVSRAELDAHLRVRARPGPDLAPTGHRESSLLARAKGTGNPAQERAAEDSIFLATRATVGSPGNRTGR